MAVKRSFLCSVLLGCVLLAAPAAGGRIWAEPAVVRIAAAANLSSLGDSLAAAFVQASPAFRAEFVYGSSGALTTQISQGAPFDVFMSADTDFPKRVYDAGLATAPPKVYAIGRLALFSIRPLDAHKGLALLRDPSVATIAIANPEVAPYGMAAMEVIEKAALQDVRPKIVYSQTISQVVQFALTSASVGFINESAIYTKELAPYAKKGVNWIPVDQSLYTPISQAFVVLKNAPGAAGAAAFARFLASASSQALFSANGYSSP